MSSYRGSGMVRTWRGAVRQALLRLDLDVRRPSRALRYDRSYPARRARILLSRGVDVVLDIGAHVGNYAEELRRNGYRSRMVSFEPLPNPYMELAQRAARDRLWDVQRVAIGDRDGDIMINVSANSWSSSVLPMHEHCRTAAPESKYIGSLTVPVVRLDSIADGLFAPSARLALKLDVQGFEMQALSGGRATLEQAEMLEIELSLVPLYRGQTLFRPMLDHLDEKGFDLVAVRDGFIDPASGHALQVDALFVPRE
jgi:FkbM family methyltransferase